MPMQYSTIFNVVKNENLQRKNFDISLIFAVLTSTYNLCFGAKIRKIGIPLQTPVFLYKMGYKGIYITRTCSPDVFK